MFEHPLPSTFKPLKLARQQGKLKGFMALDQFPALLADSLTSEGRVEADLQLEMQRRWPVLTGVANTCLKMQCQRCLEPVEVPLRAEIALGFVQSEEALEQLPENLDPFMLEEEEVMLAQLLEQELILALPIVAYHPACEQASYSAADEAVVEAPGEKPNPFKVLEQLKGRVKKTDS